MATLTPQEAVERAQAAAETAKRAAEEAHSYADAAAAMVATAAQTVTGGGVVRRLGGQRVCDFGAQYRSS